MKVAFLLDTGSSYKINEADCFVVPMVINVDNKKGEENSYFDEQNLSRSELNAFLDNNYKISTSQPIIGMWIEKIEALLKDYDYVVAVPFSKELSSTYNTVLSLKQEFGDDKLLVADVNAMSISGNWLVKELKKYLDEHNTLTQKKLDAITETIKHNLCGAVIVTDTQQLINGGRLKGIKGLIAKTLKLKLIIKYEGKLDFYGKDKTLEGAIDKTLDLINESNNFRSKGIKNIAIFADLRDDKENERYIHHVKKELANVPNFDLALLPGCVICHTGRDTFSILIESN